MVANKTMVPRTRRIIQDYALNGLLARTDRSTITPTHAYYHADGNGNVTTLINGNQTLVAKYLYDPFGNVKGSVNYIAYRV